MFVWIRDWKVARAAATFDAITLTRVYGQRAVAEARRLAARARHDGRDRHFRHWHLVAKKIGSRRMPLGGAEIAAESPGKPLRLRRIEMGAAGA
jgi:hypothetical protein